MNYAIKYRVRNPNVNRFDTNDGWVWVVNDHWGPTSSSGAMEAPRFSPPRDLMTFTELQNAVTFIEGWAGHPGYALKGDAYEIVEVERIMVTVQRGWKVKS